MHAFDPGVIQDPMFHATPVSAAYLLLNYGPTRIMFDGAYAHAFHATGQLVIALGWLIALTIAVYLVVRHALGSRT